MVTLGHLWYNLGPIHGFDQRRTIRDTTGCQVDQDSNLRLASHRLPTHPYYLHCVHSNRMRPVLICATQLRGRNELFGQLTERHEFNLDRVANNGMVLNRHRRNHMRQPTQRLCPSSSYITLWFCSTIANIANRASVSTYIS